VKGNTNPGREFFPDENNEELVAYDSALINSPAVNGYNGK
jgi:hypothetical protein